MILSFPAIIRTISIVSYSAEREFFEILFTRFAPPIFKERIIRLGTKKPPSVDDYYNYPLVNVADQPFCHICNRPLSEDNCYQVKYSSLDYCHIYKPEREMPYLSIKKSPSKAEWSEAKIRIIRTGKKLVILNKSDQKVAAKWRLEVDIVNQRSHQVGEPVFKKKMVLVCETCCICASFEEVFGFGDGRKLPSSGTEIGESCGSGDAGMIEHAIVL